MRKQLPAGVGIVEPPGTKTGQGWLRIESSRGVIWVVGDAFFNVPEKPTGPVGWILRTTRTAPGLCLRTTFIRLGLSDRRAYGAWLLGQLDRDPPNLLVPCQGEPDGEPDLAARAST